VPFVLFLKVYKIRKYSLIFVPLKVHFYLTPYRLMSEDGKIGIGKFVIE